MIHTRVARQKPPRLIADLSAGGFAINTASLTPSPSSIARCPAKLSAPFAETAKLDRDLHMYWRYVVGWVFYLQISLRASDTWKLVYIYRPASPSQPRSPKQMQCNGGGGLRCFISYRGEPTRAFGAVKILCGCITVKAEYRLTCGTTVHRIALVRRA